MSQISDYSDEVTTFGLAPLMKAHGFTKSGRTFHRRAGENWQVVNVQASQSNVGRDGRFTVNLGVYIPSVSTLAQSALTRKPKEYDCTVRRRIGRLMPDKQDYWWEINGSTRLDVIAKDVAAAVRLLGLPWLEEHSSVARVAEVLRDQPSVLSAAVALAAGDRDEARRRIQRMATERPAAAATAHTWAREQGLDP